MTTLSDFKIQMSEKSDGELYEIIIHANDFLPEAIEAARQELYKRKLDPNNTEYLKTIAQEEIKGTVWTTSSGMTLSGNAKKSETSVNLSASELYEQAFNLYEQEKNDELIERCSLLFSAYPYSKETKWALKHFPISWDSDKKIVSYNPKNLSVRKWVNQKWVYISIGLILLIQVVLGAVAYIFFGHPSGWDQSLFTFSYLITFFVGSLWTAYLSPEVTIKEPAIASMFLALTDHIIIGKFLGIVLGWILPFLIALGGAKCGEYLQKKLRGLS